MAEIMPTQTLKQFVGISNYKDMKVSKKPVGMMTNLQARNQFLISRIVHSKHPSSTNTHSTQNQVQNNCHLKEYQHSIRLWIEQNASLVTGTETWPSQR